MLMHGDTDISLFFGDAQTAISRDEITQVAVEALTHSLRQIPGMATLENLIMLKQIHSAHGYVVTSESVHQLSSEREEGDFLVTALPGCGIAILTADCLPIIFYDKTNRAVGICHAGWRGSSAAVALKTIEAMQDAFGTQVNNLQIFFGPSARVCCYEVQPDFESTLAAAACGVPLERVFSRRGDKIFFDLPLFNQLQLESLGIKKEAFNLQYNLCTIENPAFCSVRRNMQSELRQLTIALLCSPSCARDGC